MIKYSTLLYFLGKYKQKVFRITAVLLFAGVTSLLYQDIADYLQAVHPDTVIYALVGKILTVYGALIFVLFQFRPGPEAGSQRAAPKRDQTVVDAPSYDRLSALSNLDAHDTLRTRRESMHDRSHEP
jgi:hypothetical protein